MARLAAVAVLNRRGVAVTIRSWNGPTSKRASRLARTGTPSSSGLEFRQGSLRLRKHRGRRCRLGVTMRAQSWASQARSNRSRRTPHQPPAERLQRPRTGQHRPSPIGSAHVYWVEVPRQRGFEPLRQDGRVWVRRERSTVEPSPMELQELYNAFGYILTEEQTTPGVGMSGIDLEAFSTYLVRQGFEVVEGPQPAVEDDLRNRGVGRFRRIAAYDPLRSARIRQTAPKCPADWQLLDRVHRLRWQRPSCGGDSRYRSERSPRRAGGSSTRLGTRSRSVREPRRLAAEGHPATTIGGHSGSHRERRGSPRLCNHRIQGALRGFLRPRRDYQSRRAAQPHDSGRRTHRRSNPVTQRTDRQLHAQPAIHGEARPRVAGDAQRNGGIQRH